MVEAKAWRDVAVTQVTQLPHLYGNRRTNWDWLRIPLVITLYLLCVFVLEETDTSRDLFRLAILFALAFGWFLHNKVESPYTGRPLTQSPGESAATRLQLTALGYEVVEIDGTSITNLDSLVAAVGNALGPIQFPEDPSKRLRTLLGFEKRDLIPNKALIWNNAAAFAEREPNTFAWFLAEWRSMARGNDNMRLLVVEAPLAVVQRAEQFADSVTLKRLRQLMQHAPTFRV